MWLIMLYYLVLKFPSVLFNMVSFCLFRTFIFSIISGELPLPQGACLRYLLSSLWQFHHLSLLEGGMYELSFPWELTIFFWFFKCQVILDHFPNILNTVVVFWVMLKSSGEGWCFSLILFFEPSAQLELKFCLTLCWWWFRCQFCFQVLDCAIQFFPIRAPFRV